MSEQARPFLHIIESVRFDNGLLFLSVDGTTYRCELAKVAPILLEASPEEQMTFDISPSGYGIHWPLLDWDLSVD